MYSYIYIHTYSSTLFVFTGPIPLLILKLRQSAQLTRSALFLTPSDSLLRCLYSQVEGFVRVVVCLRCCSCRGGVCVTCFSCYRSHPTAHPKATPVGAYSESISPSDSQTVYNTKGTRAHTQKELIHSTLFVFTGPIPLLIPKLRQDSVTIRPSDSQYAVCIHGWRGSFVWLFVCVNVLVVLSCFSCYRSHPASHSEAA